MDGLECRELYLSYVLSKSSSGRIDSHYFEKKYDVIQNEIAKHEIRTLNEIVTVKIQTGHTPSMKEAKYYNGNVAFIKTNNLRNGFITTDFENYLTEEGNATISRTSLREGDVITTIIGANEKVIARSAIVDKSLLPANINQNIVRIRVNQEICSPEYLSTFLNCKYGKEYLYYFSRQTEQFNLSSEEVGLVRVPLFGEEFSKLITQIYAYREDLRHKANQIYLNCLELVNSTIGIDTSLHYENKVIRTFAETYMSTGRIDADYYQIEHYEHINQLNILGTISSLCRKNEKNFLPKNEKEYKYIELANIGKMGEIDGVESWQGEELPSRARRLVKTGQVLVSSVEGSISSCALITEEFDAALCSTGFYVIDSPFYNSETLFMLIKSSVIQNLLKRGCSGTILSNITKEEFDKIPLPRIEQDVQLKIKEMIGEMYRLRKQSTELLIAVKSAFELAIERNEFTAISWLKTKEDELISEVGN